MRRCRQRVLEGVCTMPLKLGAPTVVSERGQLGVVLMLARSDQSKANLERNH